MMINRFLFLAASAVLVLVSCAKDEPSMDEISFKPCIVKGSPSEYRGDMKVSAFYSSGQEKYFFNREFKYAEWKNSYYADPAAYWPLTSDGSAGIPLDFYLVSSTSGEYGLSDNRTIVLETPLSGSDDIVVGCIKNRVKEDGDMVADFSHVLTKVSFKAVGYDPSLKYVVSAVSMKAHSTGVYSFDSCSWSNLAYVKSDYSFVLSDPVGGVVIPYGTISYMLLGVPDYGLMLLPGQSPLSGSVTVTVYYKTYKSVSGSDVLNFNGSKTFDLSMVAAQDWDVNKSIVYKLLLP